MMRIGNKAWLANSRLAPLRFSRLLSSLDSAPQGEFHVDKWTFGRQALFAAAEAGRRTDHLHGQSILRPQKRALADQALADALDAIARIRLHENLFGTNSERPLDVAAMEFERLAKERLATSQTPLRRRGRPSGNAIKRAQTEAAASVWARVNGRPLPRAGVKSPHPLADFLDAVSMDLFDEVGHLSPANLRPLKK